MAFIVPIIWVCSATRVIIVLRISMLLKRTARIASKRKSVKTPLMALRNAVLNGVGYDTPVTVTPLAFNTLATSVAVALSSFVSFTLNATLLLSVGPFEDEQHVRTAV